MLSRVKQKIFQYFIFENCLLIFATDTACFELALISKMTKNHLLKCTNFEFNILKGNSHCNLTN